MHEDKIKNIESIYENAHKRLFFRKSSLCPLSRPDAPKIDYKDIKLLMKYTSDGGRILPARVSSISAKKQKELRLAIKRARALALLPFVKR